MGKLMLNVLLSFAQFEREITGERIRDKIASSKRKGMWMTATSHSRLICHKALLIIRRCMMGGRRMKAGIITGT